MGRKNTKAKDKLLRKKEEKAVLEKHAALVESANSQVDPLSSFSAFKKFTKNGLNLDLECKPVGLIDDETLEAMFNLEKNNMKSFYDDCSWGWNDKKKKAEMCEESARYLIARDQEGTPVAFSHFRFDLDYGDPVLYCYELQLVESVRRKGLGKFMMQILELFAFSANLHKVILTILKHNPGATEFYKALKYELDETSPQEGVFEEECHYEILSKLNKKIYN
ncbi:N-alpha-acetyltransferase 40 [Ischnura elegans]|uniref:N-alpha-acetyltransferase 40 n=1 Tax=Ischnura elegans TaxID=197161 RepID=UPI001ED88A51|nr:N-alpha-acetyltransferase 40 [Ischnura elegans]